MVHPKVKAGRYKDKDNDDENSLSSVGSNDNDEIDSNTDAAPSTKNSKRPRSVKQIHRKKKKNDNSDDDDDNDEPPEKRLRIRIRRQSNSLPVSHNKSPLAQKQPRTGSDDESDDDDDEESNTGFLPSEGAITIQAATATTKKQHSHQQRQNKKTPRRQLPLQKKSAKNRPHIPTKTHKHRVRSQEVFGEDTDAVDTSEDDADSDNNSSDNDDSAADNNDAESFSSSDAHSEQDLVAPNNSKIPRKGDRVLVHYPKMAQKWHKATVIKVATTTFECIYDEDLKKGPVKLQQGCWKPLPPAMDRTNRWTEVRADIHTIAVGDRLIVWWPEYQKYFPGTVQKIRKLRPGLDIVQEGHFIRYDDADEEWVNLFQRSYEPDYDSSDEQNGNEEDDDEDDSHHEEEEEEESDAENYSPSRHKHSARRHPRGQEETTKYFQCGHCLQDARQPRAMSCHHIFCRHCIRGYALDFRKQPDAPECILCQAPIERIAMKPHPLHASFQPVQALRIATGEVAHSFLTASEASVYSLGRWAPSRIIEACEATVREEQEYHGLFWRFGARYLETADESTPSVKPKNLTCPIEQVNVQTNQVVQVFVNAKQAQEVTGIDRWLIRNVLERKGSAYQAGDFFWRFQGQTHGPWPEPEDWRKKAVDEVDATTGKVLNSYSSISAAKRTLGIRQNQGCIRDVCEGRSQEAYGSFWRWGESQVAPNEENTEPGSASEMLDEESEQVEQEYLNARDDVQAKTVLQMVDAESEQVEEEFHDATEVHAAFGNAVSWDKLVEYGEEQAFWQGYLWRVKRSPHKDTEVSSDQITGMATPKKTNTGKVSKPWMQKSIEQISMDTGKRLQTFESQGEAAKFIARSMGQEDNWKKIRAKISHCCNGRQQAAEGFRWRYSNPELRVDFVPAAGRPKEKGNANLGRPRPKDRSPSRMGDSNVDSTNPHRLGESRSRNVHVKKPVEQICLETGKVLATFESQLDAGKAMNSSKKCPHQAINRCVTGRRQEAFGYLWRYAGSEAQVSESPAHVEAKRHDRKGRLVEQVCLETGNVLASFSNQSAAARALDPQTPSRFQASIGACCRGEKKVTGGYGWRYSRHGPKRCGRRGRPVEQVCLETGNVLGTFESQTVAAATVFPDQPSIYASISACCNGKRKSAGGFGWKYAGPEKHGPKRRRGRMQAVEQVCLKTGKVLGSFESQKVAAATVFPDRSSFKDSISRCCSGKVKAAGGFGWRYANSEANEPSKAKPKKSSSDKAARAVNQICEKTGNILRTFPTLKKAVKAVCLESDKVLSFQIVKSGIYACCRGENRSAYHYGWEYADDLSDDDMSDNDDDDIDEENDEED